MHQQSAAVKEYPSVIVTLFYCPICMSGAIPESLGQLRSLEELFLHGNRLTGEIPPSLGNLRRLRKLFLNSNDLVGPVPQELGRLSSLDTLNLSWNNLRGEVPASIRALVRRELYDSWVTVIVTCITITINRWLVRCEMIVWNFLSDVRLQWPRCCTSHTLSPYCYYYLCSIGKPSGLLYRREWWTRPVARYWFRWKGE